MEKGVTPYGQRTGEGFMEEVAFGISPEKGFQETLTSIR